jgi:deazaflavin-dependent oxidoreductase (nitroreductase family)
MNITKQTIKNWIPKSMLDIYPDNQWEKALFKLPVIAWRLGLGPILGRYIMIITHIGRKTGIPRRTAVEFHLMNGIKYVPCAFGAKSQWYRNIMANPRVAIQTCDGTEQMIAVRINQDEELISVIEMIQERNPALMNWYLNSIGIKPTRKEILANKNDLVFLRFDPTSDPTPRGLEVDLAWIWPAILLWSLFSGIFKKKRK